MKKLIWKELMEQRLIPLAYAALASVILVVWVMSDRHEYPKEHHYEVVLFVLMGGVYLAGIFPGSAVIAPEVKLGTLKLLDTLTGSRRRVWWAKAVAAGIVMACSVTLMAVCLYVTSIVLFGFLPFSTLFAGPGAGQWNLGVDAGLIPYSLLVFAISLFASTLVESSITAAVLSIIVGGAVSLLIGELVGQSYIASRYAVVAAMQAVGILAFLTASYAAFCRGGSLRTPKRFVIATVVLVSWIVISGVVFVAYAELNQPKEQLGTEPVQAGWTGLGRLMVGEKAIRTAYLDYPAVSGVVKATTSSDSIKVLGITPVTIDYDKLTKISGWNAPEFLQCGIGSCYEVTFEYTLQRPAGAEHQYINLFTDKGVSMGRIVLADTALANVPLQKIKTLATYRFGQVTIGQSYPASEPIDTIHITRAPHKWITAMRNYNRMPRFELLPDTTGAQISSMKFLYQPQLPAGYDEVPVVIYNPDGAPVGKVVIKAHKILSGPPPNIKTLLTFDCGRIQENSSQEFVIPLTKDCPYYGSIADVYWDNPEPAWNYVEMKNATLQHPYGAVQITYHAMRGQGENKKAIYLCNVAHEVIGRIIVKADEY